MPRIALGGGARASWPRLVQGRNFLLSGMWDAASE